MRRWLVIVAAAVVAFFVGLVVGRNTMVPAIERCHQAYQAVTKVALDRPITVRELADSNRMLTEQKD